MGECTGASKPICLSHGDRNRLNQVPQAPRIKRHSRILQCPGPGVWTAFGQGAYRQKSLVLTHSWAILAEFNAICCSKNGQSGHQNPQ